VRPDQPQRAGEDRSGFARVRYLTNAIPRLAVSVFVISAAASMLIIYSSPDQSLNPVSWTVGSLDIVAVAGPPSLLLLLAALLMVVALVALVVAADSWAARLVTDPARRPEDRRDRVLRTEVTAVRSTPHVDVTVLIPAHNEEHGLGATLASLHRQTRQPKKVWVIADNCSDRTAAIAAEHGAAVFETRDNENKKAGALNQLLGSLLPEMQESDAILVMDADTVMRDEFLDVAATHMETTPELDAVGGVFYGDSTRGLIGQLQRNEYVRYARDISRHYGRVFVLTGTASLFRADALAAVAAARGMVLPGTPGQVYDTLSLTEDNELTIALKTLGARIVSPKQCGVVTELMPTLGDLWRQRQRWQRGALENIGTYGMQASTARYWMQQLGIGYGAIALNAYLLITVLTLWALDFVPVLIFWLLMGALFMIERIVTVWDGGWRARLLAAPLLIELAYDWFLQAVYVKSIVDILTGRRREWNHVRYTAESPSSVVAS